MNLKINYSTFHSLLSSNQNQFYKVNSLKIKFHHRTIKKHLHCLVEWWETTAGG
jgi:hypothetical protein